MSRLPAGLRWAPIGIACLLLLPNARAEAPPPPSQTLTNEDIVRLVVNGTDERVILEAIATRPVDFDLEEEILVELRLVGVNDRVIEAMRLRQREMPGSRGDDEGSPGPVERSRPTGFVVVDLEDAQGDDGDQATPFAIRGIPDGVKRPPGMEVGQVSDLGLAVLCRTADHVPDHWDTRSPIEEAPRHGVLFFQPASRPDKVKKFEILRLDLRTTPPIQLAAGRHSLIIALAGRSAGSGAWHLLASDTVTVEVRPGATLRIPVDASSRLHGNHMTGYSVEHRFEVVSDAGEISE